MKKPPAISCLLLDIGGVLLTDGWSLKFRKRAAKRFDLNFHELEIRHQQAFDTYETGKLSLDEYLNRVVFHQKRSFTHAQFRGFMFEQSKPYPQMLRLFAGIKAAYGLKIVAVSNEARELNAYRIRTFKLHALFDFFVSSCYVHLRKPDPDIFRLALDMSQTPPGQSLYIDNTPMFLPIAQDLGIAGIHHTDYTSTCAKLASAGFHIDSNRRTLCH